MSFHVSWMLSDATAQVESLSESMVKLYSHRHIFDSLGFRFIAKHRVTAALNWIMCALIDKRLVNGNIASIISFRIYWCLFAASLQLNAARMYRCAVVSSPSSDNQIIF